MVALADSYSICICYWYFAVFLIILGDFYEIFTNMQKNESFRVDKAFKKAYLCFVSDAGDIYRGVEQPGSSSGS